jgi:hypothetical protein
VFNTFNIAGEKMKYSVLQSALKSEKKYLQAAKRSICPTGERLRIEVTVLLFVPTNGEC